MFERPEERCCHLVSNERPPADAGVKKHTWSNDNDLKCFLLYFFSCRFYFLSLLCLFGFFSSLDLYCSLYSLSQFVFLSAYNSFFCYPLNSLYAFSFLNIIPFIPFCSFSLTFVIQHFILVFYNLSFPQLLFLYIVSLHYYYYFFSY